ncbi:MAG TPA: hypothetical protein VFX59_07275 [Polyangiales bacterium]|nr:hypothetical protein [Polyangiales bacterium]
MRSFVLALLGCLLAQAALARPTPSVATVFPSGGNVPADRVRLRYAPSDVDMVMPRLYRLEGTIKVNVPYEVTHEVDAVWITPTVEQPLGTQLVLESEALHATYSITEKRPLPSALGTLTATTTVRSADLRLHLFDQALPFAALWHYQLFVDGRPHASFPRVYADCSDFDAGPRSDRALRPGVHLVHLSAQLADEPPLVTPDIELELRCDGPALSSAR